MLVYVSEMLIIYYLALPGALSNCVSLKFVLQKKHERVKQEYGFTLFWSFSSLFNIKVVCSPFCQFIHIVVLRERLGGAELAA